MNDDLNSTNIDPKDFDLINEEIDRRTGENAKEPRVPKFSFTLNGKEKVVTSERYSNENNKNEPQVPHFPREEKPITDDEISFPFEKTIASSVNENDEELEEEISQTMSVPKEIKEKWNSLRAGLKAAIIVPIMAGVLIGGAANAYAKYTYEKPINASHIVTLSDNKSELTDFSEIGVAIAQRVIKEQEEYNKIGRPYNIESQIRTYLGVALASVKDEFFVGAFKSYLYDSLGEGYYPDLYRGVKSAIADNVILPDSCLAYLDSLYNTEFSKDPSKYPEGIDRLIDEGKSARKHQNEAYGIVMVAEKADKALQKEEEKIAKKEAKEEQRQQRKDTLESLKQEKEMLAEQIKEVKKESREAEIESEKAALEAQMAELERQFEEVKQEQSDARLSF